MSRKSIALSSTLFPGAAGCISTGSAMGALASSTTIRSQALDQQGGQTGDQSVRSHLLTRLGVIPLPGDSFVPLWTKGDNSGYHSLFLKNDGEFECHGRQCGGSGIGSTSSSAQTSPVQIQPSGVIQFASGHRPQWLSSNRMVPPTPWVKNISGALGNANYVNSVSRSNIPFGSQIGYGRRLLYPRKNDPKPASRYGKQHKRAIGDGRYKQPKLPSSDHLFRSDRHRRRIQPLPHPEIRRKRLRHGTKQLWPTWDGQHQQLYCSHPNLFFRRDSSGKRSRAFPFPQSRPEAFGLPARNQRGQLGTGDTVDRDSSTQIVSSGVIQVISGSEHGVFLKSDGSLHVMGSNINGQLGTGDNLDRNSSSNPFFRRGGDRRGSQSHSIPQSRREPLNVWLEFTTWSRRHGEPIRTSKPTSLSLGASLEKQPIGTVGIQRHRSGCRGDFDLPPRYRSR